MKIGNILHKQQIGSQTVYYPCEMKYLKQLWSLQNLFKAKATLPGLKFSVGFEYGSPLTLYGHDIIWPGGMQLVFSCLELHNTLTRGGPCVTLARPRWWGTPPSSLIVNSSSNSNSNSSQCPLSSSISWLWPLQRRRRRRRTPPPARPWQGQGTSQEGAHLVNTLADASPLHHNSALQSHLEEWHCIGNEQLNTLETKTLPPRSLSCVRSLGRWELREPFKTTAVLSCASSYFVHPQICSYTVIYRSRR